MEAKNVVMIDVIIYYLNNDDGGWWCGGDDSFIHSFITRLLFPRINRNRKVEQLSTFLQRQLCDTWVSFIRTIHSFDSEKTAFARQKIPPSSFTGSMMLNYRTNATCNMMQLTCNQDAKCKMQHAQLSHIILFNAILL